MRAQAAVRAGAEREVPFIAPKVDRVGILVSRRVSVRRGDPDGHVRIGGDDLASHLDIDVRHPRHGYHGPVEPQQLLDRVGDEGRVGDDLAPKIGPTGQSRERRAQRRCHRVKAGQDEQE